MHSEFIAEPIMNIEGKLLGVELLTRFVSESKRPLHPAFVISGWDFDQKRLFLYKQFGVIASKQDWFEHHGLFCSLNIDYDMATLLRHDGLLQLTVSSMPFIKLEVSEEFPGIEQGLKSPILKSLCQGVNSLWLDDLGAGNANVASLLEGYFEVVKIDRHFFNEQIDKPTFPLLIKNIKRYCDKIVVEGVESRQYLDLLQEVGIWGVQGYLFKSVPFHKVEKLL
ncbi:EAL domain-containing protein [Klebsiella quasipneumoniae]|uniref:EAL domain-containing protein n=1 Tax=Klebsiella quasipneumoniae TaxID=1463165 RepID=UPI0029D70F27|nr:EAL domain-containing protein [Klebsiella quasipneumoniae]MDX7607429.1 EAL domain-containing protein [Klebsiella quasipneumoniae]